MNEHEEQQAKQALLHKNRVLPPMSSGEGSLSAGHTFKDDDKTTKYFLDNRQQRLLNDKQKIELSALLQSQKIMEQTETIFDKELEADKKSSVPASKQGDRIGTAISMGGIS